MFISYAHDDDAHIEQVETLYELLRKKGGLVRPGVQPLGSVPHCLAHRPTRRLGRCWRTCGRGNTG
ncbi:hypothetical protein STVIR_1176 [Streptomyces viridochromogenes Tue57]|uniref:Uncharacterized protein n=1 Tax=Streptomyces viridochromogenes Tue57 TaxID=1160705 RepID=L8PQT7_STRVR|nr:hypothetical protein STVIR_1176 [Streptomyces viridochromogenes Tue57]